MKTSKNDNLNALRILGVSAINKAKSGHPGIVLGAAGIVYVLFNKIMNFNPKNPEWFNRDRFILSAGHGSALLYSALHLSGYDLSIDDLKQFRQWDSKTPGHPEKTLTCGVEVTTGPLGQGVGMGVGMAVAEAHLASVYNKHDFNLIHHYTYVLCGDGDLQEGISQEAISFAGKHRLNKLILIHDSNDVQLDSNVVDVQIEDMHKRFKACNWNTIKVSDGEDLNSIYKAIRKAQLSDKPTYIEVKTVIGLGSTKQGTKDVHGAPLNDDITKVKKYFDWDYDDFIIPDSVYKHWSINAKKGEIKEEYWNQLKAKYSLKYPELSSYLDNAINKNITFDFSSLLKDIPNNDEATRLSSGKIFEKIANHEKMLIGGSADLSSSTRIKGADNQFTNLNKTGRNIMYGVREFGMGAINNGIAAHKGLIPVASGFFVFADYLKPAMRLASIMQLQQLYVFTHDSIAVGEDGPTHQPIEQLAMLRTIPNHVVLRPADFSETIACYKVALTKLTKTPASIILTRQNVKQLQHNDVLNQVERGAYIISDQTDATISLIASGSEVGLAIDVQKELLNHNIKSKVISMVSTNLFDKQDKEYQDLIINKNTKRIAIEMGSNAIWYKYVGDDGLVFGIDRFGESAPANSVIKEFGFTKENLTKKILEYLNK
ncbi:transketolase [Mycoplasma mycoides subsp. mycoides]|uniref:Transketolase n=1 Tax=Mycoplasma mycoides subsp. mycoides TaxID=2103 RepID=A0AAE2EHI4_MYCMY|nr:transketolase [Mycoplasma mycoides]AIZ55228.1 Transketolase [Mycoplasma mycoides subsp. mycoides]AME10577.1 transketolase [Mycoplasma mycoides subsp. mycoides]AME11583.1 transketolase [Mycoplasma mycoides subsp. mycoides]AME12611.1 transketolase [Mycoplasma mycoides subsp. mycoides]AME13642.1 transketolase [Mycoplasma mycoides subsp. mycoides]